MDPADQDALQQALTTQGILLGRHDRLLADVMSSLQDLNSSVASIASQLSTRTPPVAVSNPAPTPAETHPSSAVKEPFVPPPEHYSGDVGSCGRFLLQCSLVFNQQPSSYPSDKSRIAYIINLLRGKAGQWATALWEGRSSVLESYGSFISELRRVFDHPVQGREAEKRLLSLHQGSSSVASYSIDFRILAAECGWDTRALQAVFVKGLSDDVKDELATRDEPNSLDELISLAIRVDNRLRERSRERTSKARVSACPSPPPPQSLALTSSPVSPSSPGRVPSLSVEEPMQVGRARLTPDERKRRMQARLCLYCGLAGHFIASCPQTPKGRAHQ